MLISKPMLASKIDDSNIDKLRYPLIATPKFDGYRCLLVGGKALTRKFLPIRNEFVRKNLENTFAPFWRSHVFDGELIVGEIGSGKTFSDYTAGLSAIEGEPDFTYWVFDVVESDTGLARPYVDRIDDLEELIGRIKNTRVRYVAEEMIHSRAALEQYESEVLDLGFEGVCLRGLGSPYKCGRSTFGEHYLLKLKRFDDSEAQIIGFTERMHNANEAHRAEVGQLKRSSAKAGKQPMGMLGALVVCDIHTGVEFECGTGFEDTLRIKIWIRRKTYLGKVIKYRFQPSGMLDKPRHPTFLGFRDPNDL